VKAVFHAATLHRPHVDTHSRLAFVDTNIAGTLNLLEAAAAADVESIVFTSTTSVFWRRARPARRSTGRLDDRGDQAHSQKGATHRRSAPDLVTERPLNGPAEPYLQGA
jgi:nucleoside-diphosphate-sugar epimerase